jgi:hypothetical protein
VLEFSTNRLIHFLKNKNYNTLMQVLNRILLNRTDLFLSACIRGNPRPIIFSTTTTAALTTTTIKRPLFRHRHTQKDTDDLGQPPAEKTNQFNLPFPRGVNQPLTPTRQKHIIEHTQNI